MGEGKGLVVGANPCVGVKSLFPICYRASCTRTEGCRLIMNSKLDFAGKAPVRAFAVLELFHHVTQVFGCEIGPALGQKAEFGERAFPEQKIGKALLTARANQEIDVSGAAALNFGEHVAER